jgi:hypothetical protein
MARRRDKHRTGRQASEKSGDFLRFLGIGRCRARQSLTREKCTRVPGFTPAQAKIDVAMRFFIGAIGALAALSCWP